MKMNDNRRINTHARASPRSDGQNAKETRASPLSNEKQSKKRETTKIRIATWNIGSLTERSAELAEVLKRRCVNICCIQETKWKGSKARSIGNGFKHFYHGTVTNRNGVGIILDAELQENILEVNRVSDRIISAKLAIVGKPCMNIISAYAP